MNHDHLLVVEMGHGQGGADPGPRAEHPAEQKHLLIGLRQGVGIVNRPWGHLVLEPVGQSENGRLAGLGTPGQPTNTIRHSIDMELIIAKERIFVLWPDAANIRQGE